MTKKRKMKNQDKYGPANEPFEAIMVFRGTYAFTVYPEQDNSGCDDDWNSLDNLVLDYPGIWQLKLQRMVWMEITINQDGTEEADMNGMYYDILEKKCIYAFKA